MSSDHELSDYLLGELDPETHARFEQRLSEDPALRARAEALRPLVGRLETLPQDAWETMPAQPSAATSRPPRRRRALTLRPLVAAAAAAALLAIGVAGGLLVDGGDGAAAPEGPAVALRAVDGAPASSSALARMTGGGHMLLTVRGLPPAKPGAYYEAWLMSDGKHLVPIASFTVDAAGEARIDVPLPASAKDYRYVDISLQQAADGTEHSSRSVLRGDLS